MPRGKTHELAGEDGYQLSSDYTPEFIIYELENTGFIQFKGKQKMTIYILAGGKNTAITVN